jgi:large-conductance mechanosensitive channel
MDISMVVPISKDDLQKFVQNNNVAGYAIAMIIALTVKDLIASFIGDFLVPGINVFLIGLNLKKFSKYLPGNEKIDGLRLIKSFLTFLLTFLIVYFTFI